MVMVSKNLETIRKGHYRYLMTKNLLPRHQLTEYLDGICEIGNS